MFDRAYKTITFITFAAAITIATNCAVDAQSADGNTWNLLERSCTALFCRSLRDSASLKNDRVSRSITQGAHVVVVIDILALEQLASTRFAYRPTANLARSGINLASGKAGAGAHS